MTWRGAQHYPWWWNSWGDRGFLRGLAEGMTEAGGGHDVWRVGGRPVADWQQLQSRKLAQHQGHFRWAGSNMPAVRDAGADQLVDYVNTVSTLTDEPLRIIAHSHGCNLVKSASSHRQLSNGVFIDRAVFLACPHFAAESGGGLSFPYRLGPCRFGGDPGPRLQGRPGSTRARRRHPWRTRDPRLGRLGNRRQEPLRGSRPAGSAPLRSLLRAYRGGRQGPALGHPWSGRRIPVRSLAGRPEPVRGWAERSDHSWLGSGRRLKAVRQRR